MRQAFKCDNCEAVIIEPDFFPYGIKSCGEPACERAARQKYVEMRDREEEERERREAERSGEDEIDEREEMPYLREVP